MSWFLKGVETLTSATTNALQEAQNIGTSLVDKITEVEGDDDQNKSMDNNNKSSKNPSTSDHKSALDSARVTSSSTWNEDSWDKIEPTKASRQISSNNRNNSSSSSVSNPPVAAVAAPKRASFVPSSSRKTFQPQSNNNVLSLEEQEKEVLSDKNPTTQKEPAVVVPAKKTFTMASSKKVSSSPVKKQKALSSPTTGNAFSNIFFDLNNDQDDDDDAKKAEKPSQKQQVVTSPSEQQFNAIQESTQKSSAAPPPPPPPEEEEEEDDDDDEGWSMPSFWAPNKQQKAKLTEESPAIQKTTLPDAEQKPEEQKQHHQYKSTLFSAFEIGAGAILSTLDAANQALERANLSEYEKISNFLRCLQEQEECSAQDHDQNKKYETLTGQIKAHLEDALRINIIHHQQRSTSSTREDRASQSESLDKIFGLIEIPGKSSIDNIGSLSSSPSAFHRLETLLQDFQQESTRSISSMRSKLLQRHKNEEIDRREYFVQLIENLEANPKHSLYGFALNWAEAVTQEVQIFGQISIASSASSTNLGSTASSSSCTSSSSSHLEELLDSFCNFAVKILHDEAFLDITSSSAISAFEEDLFACVNEAYSEHEEKQNEKSSQDKNNENEKKHKVLSKDEVEEIVFKKVSFVRRECFQTIVCACFVVEKVIQELKKELLVSKTKQQHELLTNDEQQKLKLPAEEKVSTPIASSENPKKIVFQPPKKKAGFSLSKPTTAGASVAKTPASSATSLLSSQQDLTQIIAKPLPEQSEDVPPPLHQDEEQISSATTENTQQQQQQQQQQHEEPKKDGNESTTTTPAVQVVPIAKKTTTAVIVAENNQEVSVVPQNRLKKGKGFSMRKA